MRFPAFGTVPGRYWRLACPGSEFRRRAANGAKIGNLAGRLLLAFLFVDDLSVRLANHSVPGSFF